MATKDIIQKAAESAIDAVRKSDGAVRDANTLADQTRDAKYSKREELLLGISAAAIKGKWKNDDIDAGVKAAVAAKAGNAKDTSLSTWASEIKRACNERIRDHVETFFAVSTRLWNAEKAALEADSDAPAPLSTAFARKIQLAHALMSAAHGSKDTSPVILTDEADIVAFCEARDPAQDHKRIAKRIAAMRKTFAEFAEEFPHPAFASVDKLLDNLSPESLLGARGKASEPAPVTKPKPVKLTRGEPAPAAEPVEGASDMFDGLDFQTIQMIANKAKAALATR